MLRRSQGNEAVTLTCGALTFDTVSRLFHYGGELLSLTPREYAVLEVLITRAGRVVSFPIALAFAKSEINKEPRRGVEATQSSCRARK